jgi:hypothetical protein
LNHHPTNDFIIDLDNIWKWLGFSQKARVKELLEKHFVSEKDYIKPLSLERKQTSGGRGGHNKETFLMNVKTFKALCLKAGTKKADQIHDYYMKLEEIIQEVVSEECFELKSCVNGTCVADEDESVSTQVPIKRKTKRSVDQIHKDTGEVICCDTCPKVFHLGCLGLK